jgi:hypothetical protein
MMDSRLADHGDSHVAKSIINSQPQSLWLGGWSGHDRTVAYEYVHSAIVKGEIPTLTLYRIPFRDCHQASGNGVEITYAQYQSWVTDVAYGIGDAINGASASGLDHPQTPIVVLLEPDSIGLVPMSDHEGNAKACWNDDGSPMFDVKERFDALSRAADTLASAAGTACYLQSGRRPTSCPSWQSRVKVYLDGGHSGWQGGWPDEMARRMIAAGIQRAAGFFTNSSNYRILGDPNSADPTSGELPYGRVLRESIRFQLGGHSYGWGLGSCDGLPCSVPPKNQIIDVSRNGSGVNPSSGLFTMDAYGDVVEYQRTGWPMWCDNLKARVGQAPTANPQSLLGLDYVDALLWIKPPGETDGCWGGPNTEPNTQPEYDTLLNDDYLRPGSAAGWPSKDLACGLVTGNYTRTYVDANDHTVNYSCGIGYNQPVLPIPPAPKGVRIAAFNVEQNTVTLEWQPSLGACAYMVGASVNNGSFSAVPNSFIAAEGGSGPATRYIVKPAVHGKKVQYGVKARKCDGIGTQYSGYGTSTLATAVLFP